ncbi:hypothetical protein N7456_001664 [Penicillium angulare]|uniref:Uncharacterized protein n=1 Tax=Penicillium angulare TaxID=116970 RepID=A0A9W9KP26_9EURO|nr:hypothetical protein N7456_001664 [Penicillium angulare]
MSASDQEGQPLGQPEPSLVLSKMPQDSWLADDQLYEFYSDIVAREHDHYQVAMFYQLLLFHWLQTSTTGATFNTLKEEVPGLGYPDLLACQGTSKEPPYLLGVLCDDNWRLTPEKVKQRAENLGEIIQEIGRKYFEGLGEVDEDVQLAGLVAIGTQVKCFIMVQKAGTAEVTTEINPPHRGQTVNLDDPLFHLFLVKVAKDGQKRVSQS